MDELGNLLMNMSAGLLPKDLCQSEIDLLQSKYGDNWFERLGYSESRYQKPVSM